MSSQATYFYPRKKTYGPIDPIDPQLMSRWSEINFAEVELQATRKRSEIDFAEVELRTASTWFERSSAERIRQALEEVRAEAEEERRLDKELDPIPDSAYEEVRLFFRKIDEWFGDTSHTAIYLPDIAPLDNGQICLEWRTKQQIFTLNFEGNGSIVLAGIFSEQRRIRGILTFLLFDIIAIASMILRLDIDDEY